MASKERIGKRAKRQPVSALDSDPTILPGDEHDSDDSSWGYREVLQGNRNECVGINSSPFDTEKLSEGGNSDNSKYPTEVEGFNADAVGGIPLSTTTINTTTLQLTIISSLDPVSVRIWEQEQKALVNAGINNPPSHRLSDPALTTLASIVYSNHT